MRLAVALLTALAAGAVVATALGLVPERRRRPRTTSRAQEWLVQAGVSTTPLQFWMTSVGSALLTLLLLSWLTSTWAISLVPAVLVGMLPRLYFASQRRQRLGELRQAWPDGLRDLVASIAAGRSLARALEALADEGPEPLRRVLAPYSFLARSLGVVPALETIRDQAADPTTDRVIEVLIVAHEKGGAIVPDILRDLAEATARDVWAAEEFDTAALEYRINARVVFILPWLVLVAMTVRAGPFREFYATPLGLAVIAVGGVMSLGGAVLVSRLGRTPDEPRVLGR